MEIKTIEHSGWKNNVLLANEHAELIVTLDVGPRIISYKTPHGENVLKTYEEQLGGMNESEWMIRGGHRFWLAPEHEELTYQLDNSPVQYKQTDQGITFENPPIAPWNIRKQMTLRLAPDSSEVFIEHRAINEGNAPVTISTWGLSVMAPGGLEIIPQPPMGHHPEDLLPDRVIVPWTYTDLSDPRYRLGRQFITLRQTADGAPTKLGLLHRQKWVGYLLRNECFIKTFDSVKDATYPDFGCNFETFTDRDMLEIETLSPLETLAPGESLAHTENWYLFSDKTQPNSLKEMDLAQWLEPRMKNLGLEI